LHRGPLRRHRTRGISGTIGARGLLEAPAKLDAETKTIRVRFPSASATDGITRNEPEVVMPKKCSKCNYYSASTDETECPKCQAPLQFTLPAPPNQEAAPLEGLPSPVQKRTAPDAGGGFDVITWSMQNWVILVFAVPLVIAVLALAAGSLGGAGQSKFDQL